MAHRKIPAAVKAEAIRLVVEVGYTPPQAARMMGLGPTALRRWVEEWRERQAAIPDDPVEQRRLIAQLQGQLKASEDARAVLAQERDVLKKQLPSHLAAILRKPRSSKR
jgi:transposase-like protein